MFILFIAAACLLNVVTFSGSSVNAEAISNNSVSNNTSDQSQLSSVSESVAASVAATAAKAANLPVANNAANLSVSIAAVDEMSKSSTTSSVALKPQIVKPSSSERKTIVYYTTNAGDTVESVASKYSLSADTIKWVNNLTSDSLDVNEKLTILPVDGVLYTVKTDDTVSSIAQKYGVSAERIISFNDLELTGIKVGQQIILPGGVLPDDEKPKSPVTNSIANVVAGNGYDYGYCTWYVYNRRAQHFNSPVGSFWGNAASWIYYAELAGYSTGHAPKVGAVMQTSNGYYGHVAVVENVYSDGSIRVSEMNYSGWDVVDYRTISASSVYSYNYIY